MIRIDVRTGKVDLSNTSLSLDSLQSIQDMNIRVLQRGPIQPVAKAMADIFMDTGHDTVYISFGDHGLKLTHIPSGE